MGPKPIKRLEWNWHKKVHKTTELPLGHCPYSELNMIKLTRPTPPSDEVIMNKIKITSNGREQNRVNQKQVTGLDCRLLRIQGGIGSVNSSPTTVH